MHICGEDKGKENHPIFSQQESQLPPPSLLLYTLLSKVLLTQYAQPSHKVQACFLYLLPKFLSSLSLINIGKHHTCKFLLTSLKSCSFQSHFRSLQWVPSCNQRTTQSHLMPSSSGQELEPCKISGNQKTLMWSLEGDGTCVFCKYVNALTHIWPP